MRDIKEIVEMLYERKHLNQPKPIILLGAGASITSGCPTLKGLYKALANKAKHPELASNYEAMDRHLATRGQSYNELYGQLINEVTAVGPSPGYHYLCDLVIHGYFDLIFTLNFDTILEDILSRHVRSEPYLKLIRGEHSEKFISNAINIHPPRVKLIKLHGDLHTRSFMLETGDMLKFPPELELSLTNLIRSLDILLIGTQMTDMDVLTVLPKDKGSIWYINPNPPEQDSPIARILRGRSMIDNIIAGDIGNFDNFFRQLALEIGKMELRNREEEQRKMFNRRLRDGLRQREITYSDKLIRKLGTEISDYTKDPREQTLLVYIHDPAAPGGSEIEKRIKPYLEFGSSNPPESIILEVKGTEIRWLDRAVTGSVPKKIRGQQFSQVVIIDSISFTGRTLQLATKAIREAFPRAEIIWAVLVISKELVKRLPEMGIHKNRIISIWETDKTDIFFPWGWTQATGSMRREIKLYDSIHFTEVIQRPWGAIEVLSNNLECSVRIHTIRAGHRLSLQRHTIRDELFIPLDDNVGIEFESEDGSTVEAAILPKGEYVTVNRGVKHRFAAYRDTGRLLEIAFGYYDMVHDIERFEDDYGREGKLGDV